MLVSEQLATSIVVQDVKLVGSWDFLLKLTLSQHEIVGQKKAQGCFHCQAKVIVMRS